jgi:hypothetical protein
MLIFYYRKAVDQGGIGRISDGISNAVLAGAHRVSVYSGQDLGREEADVASRDIDQWGRCAGDERCGAGGGADGFHQGLGRDGDLGRLQGTSGGQDLPDGSAPARRHQASSTAGAPCSGPNVRPSSRRRRDRDGRRASSPRPGSRGSWSLEGTGASRED